VLVPPERSSDLRAYYSNHTKTDRLDSRLLARLPLLHPEGLHEEQGLGPGDPLRRATRLHQTLTKRRSQSLARLDALLEILGPAWLGVFGADLSNKTPLRFLAACYACPNTVKRLGKARLARFLYRHSRGRWGQEQAEALLKAAAETLELWGDELDYGELARGRTERASRRTAPAGGGTVKAVIYLRVSTKEQAEEGYSIPAQAEACRRFIADRGWELADEYVDRGESARTANRPQLQAMLARLTEDPSVDRLVVHKLDRLARNLEDHAAVRAALRKAGVQLHSVTESLEDSASGKLVEGILASIAEFYSANLGQEIRKGLDQRRRRAAGRDVRPSATATSDATPPGAGGSRCWSPISSRHSSCGPSSATRRASCRSQPSPRPWPRRA